MSSVTSALGITGEHKAEMTGYIMINCEISPKGIYKNQPAGRQVVVTGPPGLLAQSIQEKLLVLGNCQTARDN